MQNQNRVIPLTIKAVLRERLKQLQKQRAERQKQAQDLSGFYALNQVERSYLSDILRQLLYTNADCELVCLSYESQPGEVSPLWLEDWLKVQGFHVVHSDWSYRKGIKLREPNSSVSYFWEQYQAALERKLQRPVLLGIIVLPSLGVTTQGFRIGYGLGCYDRFLGSRPWLAGSFFDPQRRRQVHPMLMALTSGDVVKLSENFIPEHYDYPVDVVVTERTFYHSGLRFDRDL